MLKLKTKQFAYYTHLQNIYLQKQKCHTNVTPLGLSHIGNDLKRTAKKKLSRNMADVTARRPQASYHGYVHTSTIGY